MCKFQLEITSNKKVIAKKPLTNLYEMNSSNSVAGLTSNLFVAQSFIPHKKQAEF